VLDVIRTILQTAVAAGVPVHEYLVDVLCADAEDIEKQPERFTPHAWAARQHTEQQPSDTCAPTVPPLRTATCARLLRQERHPKQLLESLTQLRSPAVEVVQMTLNAGRITVAEAKCSPRASSRSPL